MYKLTINTLQEVEPVSKECVKCTKQLVKGKKQTKNYDMFVKTPGSVRLALHDSQDSFANESKNNSSTWWHAVPTIKG